MSMSHVRMAYFLIGPWLHSPEGVQEYDVSAPRGFQGQKKKRPPKALPACCVLIKYELRDVLSTGRFQKHAIIYFEDERPQEASCGKIRKRECKKSRNLCDQAVATKKVNFQVATMSCTWNKIVMQRSSSGQLQQPPWWQWTRGEYAEAVKLHSPVQIKEVFSIKSWGHIVKRVQNLF